MTGATRAAPTADVSSSLSPGSDDHAAGPHSSCAIAATATSLSALTEGRPGGRWSPVRRKEGHQRAPARPRRPGPDGPQSQRELNSADGRNIDQRRLTAASHAAGDHGPVEKDLEGHVDRFKTIVRHTDRGSEPVSALRQQPRGVVVARLRSPARERDWIVLSLHRHVLAVVAVPREWRQVSQREGRAGGGHHQLGPLTQSPAGCGLRGDDGASGDLVGVGVADRHARPQSGQVRDGVVLGRAAQVGHPRLDRHAELDVRDVG